MRTLPDTSDRQLVVVNTAASGGASVITLAAPGDAQQNVIDSILCSYATSPTAGLLTISGVQGTSGAVTISVDVTAAGPVVIYFREPGLLGVENTAMVVTLADGTAAKDLNIFYR